MEKFQLLLINIRVEPGIGTLVAAVIAAFISIIISIYTYINQKKAEARASYRSILADHIVMIGDQLHELMALSKILIKRDKSTNEKHNVKLLEIKSTLESSRRKIIYTLPTIEKSIRTIIRLPDWINHKLAVDKLDEAKELYQRSNELKKKVDLVISNCFIKGRPPSGFEKRKIENLEKKVLAYYNETRASNSFTDKE